MLSIAPFSTPGRFWRGNLHTHSNLSDGGLAPEAVIAAYKRNGHDFLQLSEHFLDRFGWQKPTPAPSVPTPSPR